MDEVLFRSADKLENLQFRLSVAGNEGKIVAERWLHALRERISYYLQATPALEIQLRLHNVIGIILKAFAEVRHSIANRLRPILNNFTWQRLNTPIIICCVGFLFGTALGFFIGRQMYHQNVIIPRDKMQAIQVLTYQIPIGSSTDVVSLVHGADAPNICGPHDVIVQVEAGSLQLIDLGIAKGYGRHIRYFLNRFSKFREASCPVTLGRDCVGTILSVGVAVRRLEVGDSVWVSVPYWAAGVLAQRITVPEHCVGIRPARFGAQACCSFPYAGAVALHTLRDGRVVTKTDANDKRILVLGGCTPVGCLLTQILTAWGGHVTATCPARAPPVMEALGAADIIPIHDNVLFSPTKQQATGDHRQMAENGVVQDEDDRGQLMRHLGQRPPFDLVIVTQECRVSMNEMLQYCRKGGTVLDTRPMAVDSDRYGALRVTVFGWCMYLKFVLMGLFGSNDLNSYNEVPMGYEVLDQLSAILEKYRIKPVIGKVYHATDIVGALKQVSASNTIGTTVVTFQR